MTRGKAVQVGSADALFERPAHTFVGHFIGSPGMNFLPHGELTLGVRPEYVRLAEPDAAGAVRGQVAQLQDIGTYLMLTATVDGRPVKARLAPDVEVPAVGEPVWLQVQGEHTCYYKNEELVA